MATQHTMSLDAITAEADLAKAELRLLQLLEAAGPRIVTGAGRHVSTLARAGFIEVRVQVSYGAVGDDLDALYRFRVTDYVATITERGREEAAIMRDFFTADERAARGIS